MSTSTPTSTQRAMPIELYPNIYYFTVPLPNNPLRELNVYLIKGEGETLLIDTGFNRPECEEALMAGLKALEVDLSTMNLLITHLHADHSGLAGLFCESSPNIYASRMDGGLMNSIPDGGFEERANRNIHQVDLAREALTFDDLPGHAFAYKETINFSYLDDGDTLSVGDYTFHIIDAAGHTPGMITLYEPDHQLYFSADHVLDQISPNITFWDFEFDALEHYLKNLDKIISLKIKHIFPAHRNQMDDHPRRVLELIEHHHQRLIEVFNLITSEEQSAQTIASQMSWHIRANSWKDFPLVQKYFATGEAMAHLEYLHHQDRIVRHTREGIIYYSLP